MYKKSQTTALQHNNIFKREKREYTYTVRYKKLKKKIPKHTKINDIFNKQQQQKLGVP